MTQEQDKTQAAGDEVKTERKRPSPKPKTAQSPVDDVKQSDQNATAKNSEETGNAGTEAQASESASSSQTELEVEQQINSAAADQPQQGGDEKNNEEIVVQKKTIPQPHNPLEVTVRNNGLSAVYEPSTKTSIKAGETVTIECPTNTVKQTVLGNIKQFKALGKNVEVLNGRS